MIIAFDPTGNLTSPSFTCRGTVVNNTIVPLAQSDWDILTKLKNWQVGEPPNAPNPPIPNSSVVSIQPGNFVQARVSGTAAAFELWQFNGNVAAISPNLSSNFGSDTTTVAWLYQVIG